MPHSFRPVPFCEGIKATLSNPVRWRPRRGCKRVLPSLCRRWCARYSPCRFAKLPSLSQLGNLTPQMARRLQMQSIVPQLFVLAGAFALLERRDLGAGLLPARRGRARAGAALAGAGGLAWRLGRPSLIGWTTGMFIGGIVIGSLAKSAMDMFNDPAIADLLSKMGGGVGLLSDVYLSTELGFIAVVAAAYGVTAALRWRSEETQLHAEHVLATATSRTRYAASHVTVAVIGTAVLVLALGLGTALADAAGGGTLGGAGRVLPAALVRLPAVWVCVAVAIAAVGWLPRWTAAIGWGALAFFLVVGEFGGVLGLPQWLMNLAPFTHVPRMPVEQFAWTPTLWLCLVAAGSTGLGMVGFRRRDIG